MGTCLNGSHVISARKGSPFLKPENACCTLKLLNSLYVLRLVARAKAAKSVHLVDYIKCIYFSKKVRDSHCQYFNEILQML